MSTVLLIEDNPAHARLAFLLLTHAGHAPLHAASAESGLAIAREQAPNLVLMDIDLPGLCGLDALRQLKADPATAAIPVVMMTSYLADEPQAEAQAAGAAGFISKPYHYTDFIATVRTALGT